MYADLDENNYGPINYKAASIYNMVKFKGRTQNWDEYNEVLLLLTTIYILKEILHLRIFNPWSEVNVFNKDNLHL